ncbi:MAG: carboxymuconolactone decarboxylase family protein [Pseudomonadota bacterium]
MQTAMPSRDVLQPEAGWATAATVRIPPPPPARRGLLFRTVSRASALFGRPELPDIFPVLHTHPMLFWTWLLFASRMMPFGRLDAVDREKLILRTGWNCRSRYEWGQHVDIALGAGATDADIVRVAQGPGAWEDRHGRALMQACDELCTNHCIADDTWQTLAEKYDDALRIEIAMLVGHYQMIAGFLNSTGIVLEAPLEEKLQAFHARISGQCH